MTQNNLFTRKFRCHSSRCSCGLSRHYAPTFDNAVIVRPVCAVEKARQSPHLGSYSRVPCQVEGVIAARQAAHGMQDAAVGQKKPIMWAASQESRLFSSTVQRSLEPDSSPAPWSGHPAGRGGGGGFRVAKQDALCT